MIFLSTGVAATKDDKDDKDDSIMTPAKDDNGKQWWSSSHSLPCEGRAQGRGQAPTHVRPHRREQAVLGQD